MWQADASYRMARKLSHPGLADAGSHRLLSSVSEGGKDGESGE